MKESPDGQRQAFWAFVRGRMAVLRLRHKAVDTALNLDRSVLTRRLAGRIKERPGEAMVDGLASALRLDAPGTRHLHELAGYGGDDASIEAVEPDPAGDGLRQGPGTGPRQLVISAGALLLTLTVGVAALMTWPSGQPRSGRSLARHQWLGAGRLPGTSCSGDLAVVRAPPG